MGHPPTIIWFRHDLRLADNPALTAALECGGPIIPVYIWAPEEEKPWAPGAAARWWLHQSLASLDETLRQRGARLVIRQGSSQASLLALVRETEATAVFWNRRYEPKAVAKEAEVTASLRAQGIITESFNASLLFEPGTLRNRAGKPFQVFTPFWKACLSLPAPKPPLPMPSELCVPKRWPKTLALARLELEPKVDWAAGLRAAWQPGEPGASEQLARFLDERLVAYTEQRNRPGGMSSSRLSPHLHFGEISPRQVWRAIQERAAHGRASGGADAYLRQLGWREFAHNLLFHFPLTPEQPLRSEFAAFPWRDDAKALRAWRQGQTGYPLVDAGMSELWRTGWMHNRVRMVVASFLVKHLLLPWQLGAQWFWDTLVDADLANNTLGWQWTAGCGADAAPYFRIFNPVGQGERFDPNGDYIRRWVPELTHLSADWIHKPWEAPSAVLEKAGVELGRTYPLPIVEHTHARVRALEALARIKKKG